MHLRLGYILIEQPPLAYVAQSVGGEVVAYGTAVEEDHRYMLKGIQAVLRVGQVLEFDFKTDGQQDKGSARITQVSLEEKVVNDRVSLTFHVRLQRVR